MKRCTGLIKIILASFLLFVSPYSFAQSPAASYFPQLDCIIKLRPNLSIGDEITLEHPICILDVPFESYSLNDTLAKIINLYPDIIFAVESHTDCRASAEYNRALSQRRADTLRNQLLPLLKDTSQLPLAIGKGEDELFIKKCQCDLSDYKHTCTEAEHQQNRRTVIKVIGYKLPEVNYWD